MATFVKLPSGSWRALVRKGGVNKSSAFILKRDAIEWAQRTEMAIAQSGSSGYIKPQAGTTVSKLIDSYRLQLKHLGRSKEAVLKNLSASNIGAVAINRLAPIHLREYVDKRMETAGGVTIAIDLSYLGSVLKWAREAKHLDVNPQLALDARASLKHRGLNTRGKERTRRPTEDELNRLYAHFDGRSRSKIPMSDIVRFATLSAMRLGEICELRIEDLSKDCDTILVRARKHPDPEVKELNDQVVPLLGDASVLAKKMKGKRKEGKLFPLATEVAVGASFTRACSDLGIKDLHFHDMRHEGITRLFQAGLRIEQVAVVSGHRDWKMLKRYTHLKADDVLKAFKGLKK